MLFRFRKFLSQVYKGLLTTYFASHNFYRKFIKDYSQLILPLTQLTKKGQSFVWTKEADTAFVDLKKAFTSTPILTHVDPQKPFIIEAGASDYALGSIL